MKFLEWGKQYEVGISKIDEQHEHLFDLVNMLYDSIVEGQEQNALGEVLNELISYTVYHFETEEKLFQEYEYPQVAEHKAEHDELTKQVLELREQFELKVVTITFEVMDFLSDWLKKHTTESDLKFADFLRAKSN